jgi:hypothetical protein
VTKINKTKVEDEEIYLVELARTIKVGAVSVRPGANVKLKGKVIKQYATDVISVDLA